MSEKKATISVKALVQLLMRDIQNNQLVDVENKLPSEQTLMRLYQASRYAVRQALLQLSNMGYLYQAHGMGTFLRPHFNNKTIAIQSNVGLTEEIARQGKVIKTLKAVQKETTASQAEFLPVNNRLSPETALIEIIRYRLLDDTPYLVEHSYYLKTLVGNIPDSALYGSLFNFLENHAAVKVGFIDKMITSQTIDKPKTADFFQLKTTDPMLVVQDETHLTSGQLFVFSKNYYDYRQAQLYMFKKID